MEATVSEIHAYPLRPEGYAEPLFHDQSSRKEILDHLAGSEWLDRASEARRPRAHTGAQPTGYVAVLASWREVDRWWEEDGGVDVIWRRVETRDGRQEVRAETTSQPASAA